MSADQDVPTTYAEAAWERGAATAEEHGRPREEVTPAAESGGNDEAEDAERAPFGESNTFRYVAATGVAVEALPPLITPLKLHVEASYQVTLASGEVGDEGACAGERDGGQVSLLADDYYDDDEAAPAEQVTAEEPFVVLTLGA